MNRYIYISIFIIIVLLYYNFKTLRNLEEFGNTERRRILAFQQVISDKLDIKEGEIRNRDIQLAKYEANIQAFQGTDCMRCHVVENSLQLPMNNNLLTFSEFQGKVRTGGNLMPSYKNTAGKTRNEITDTELRRIYGIIKVFSDKYY